MSMISCLRQVSDEEIDKLLQNPKYIREFLNGIQKPPEKRGFLRFLFTAKIKIHSEPVPEWVHNTESIEECLDKGWHGIHYLLTETDWEGNEPLCYLVKGGEEIGDIDVGYGPARAIKSQQVKKFADALNIINVEELKKKFNPQKMIELDIYPTIWNRDPKEDDTLGYIIEFFNILRSFVNQAAEKNKGLIIYLC